MNQKRIAPTRKTNAVARAEAGAPVPPCLPFSFSGTAGGFAAGLAARAGQGFGAGRRQGAVSSLITVEPAVTAPSMLASNLPSFALHSSSLRRRRLVA